MRHLPLLFVAIVAGLFTNCSKSNSASGGGKKAGTFPFSNSDYTGVMTELTREYQKPILLRFGTDSSVTAYAIFNLTAGGRSFTQDSLQGTIVRIGTGNDGNPAVTVYMAATADTQVYTFAPDYSSVNGGSNGLASNQFYATILYKAPDKPASLATSFWTTDTARGYNFGSYPDIDGVTFMNGGITQYIVEGTLQNTGPEGVPPDQPISFSYDQSGSMVFFYGSGVDPTNKIIGIQYFGVISPDGNTITADSRSSQARIPVYGEPDGPYGDPGNPPTMHRHQ